MKKVLIIMMVLTLVLVGCDETSSINTNENFTTKTEAETAKSKTKLTHKEIDGYSVSSDEEWYITYICDDNNLLYADFEMMEYSDEKIKEIKESGCQLGYTMTGAVVWGNQEADSNGNYLFYVFDTELEKVGSFHIYTDRNHANIFINKIPFNIGWE